MSARRSASDLRLCRRSLRYTNRCEFAAGSRGAGLLADSSSPTSYVPTSYSIASIDPNDGYIVGDKIFKWFTVTTTAQGGALAPDATGINVTGVEVNGDYGLRFNSGWSASGGQLVDSSITFYVAVTPAAAAQGYLLADNNLKMTLYGNTTTLGEVSVSEQLYAQNPALPGSPFVNELVWYKSDTNQLVTMGAQFTPTTGMWVGKDVIANGGTDTLGVGVAHLSEFYQTFSQVPEPSMFVLLGIGGLGLVGYVWRKRRG